MARSGRCQGVPSPLRPGQVVDVVSMPGHACVYCGRYGVAGVQCAGCGAVSGPGYGRKVQSLNLPDVRVVAPPNVTIGENAQIDWLRVAVNPLGYIAAFWILALLVTAVQCGTGGV